jgi:DNA-directed RNA polymerase subunit N
MIIPVKCFTCGGVIGDLYRYFMREVRQMKFNKELSVDKVIYMTRVNKDKTPEGIVLDRLNLKKICCRRHMLTHVDIE